MLEVKEVDVCYGTLQVLFKVSLRVREGEIVTVVGGNGAGKSTILKTISGLLKPISGSIEFYGNKIHLMPGYEVSRLGIAQIPEGRRVFPNMTVLENLKLGAYAGNAKKKRKETLETMFQMFPVLQERKKQMARTLSGGEQQMLAIGRGLMSRPKLLMLDEPSLGLAPVLVEELYETIEKILKKDVSILLVEQNVSEALRTADRGYVLENGRIIMEGSKEELQASSHIKEAYLGV